MYKISYGITGNYYVTSIIKSELVKVCKKIGKSPNSISWHEKYQTFVFRVKNKTQKNKLKQINEGNNHGTVSGS